jgi:integrase
VALNNVRIESAKPSGKPYKLADEKGLYLLVQPTGHKWWRLKYRFGSRKDGRPGKAEKVLALGVYPDVPLKLAREKRDEARQLLANGVDPSAQRRADEHAQRIARLHTFRAVATAWMDRNRPKWTESHGTKTRRRFEQHVFPWIGDRAVRDVSRADMREVLRRIEGTGRVETAHRVLQLCKATFDYANNEEITDRNPCGGLQQVLPPVEEHHHPTITDPKRVAELLRAIDAFGGTLPVACALRLAPLLFVRPGELRKARWEEFDLDAPEPLWRIPAERMKMGEQHLVPLSTQAVALLRDLRPLTGPHGYVFPGARNASRPMSENTLNAALRRLGYDKGTMTAHGFRSMASTILNEQQWHKDAIERQLAHGERDKVRGSYNFAEHLPERRKMMQAWADYLDGLRAGARVIGIRRAAS